jgi:hypothetical protein
MKDNITINTNTNTKTKTTSMTNQSSCKSHEQIDQELKKPHQHKNKEQQQKQETTIVEAAEEVVMSNVVTEICVEEEEESGRERLKRHRVEMGGNVWIPDLWGQEEFLKDWIDCTKFDPPLISSNKIVTARTALVQEATGGGTAGFRFHYSC